MANRISNNGGIDRVAAGPAVAFEGAGYALPDGGWIVRDLTLVVEGRETVVLVGRSGAGKTTALKLVNRLIDPSEGRVVVGGVPTAEWDPVTLRRRTGWVIQEVGLFPRSQRAAERGGSCPSS